MNAISLDIRTVSFLAMFIMWLFAVGLFLYGHTQKKFHGFHFMALGSAVIGFGMLFLTFRDVFSDFITIVLANTLLLCGLVLYYDGIRRFLGTQTQLRYIGVAAILINLGVFYYYTYTIPSVNQRIISINAMGAILTALSAREFLRGFPTHWKVPRIMLAVMFAGFSAFSVFRVIWTLREEPITSFMSAGIVHAFSFISYILLIIGLTFGMIWMISRQLEFELTELANQDQLTKILNRRGVNFFTDREFSKMKRGNTALAMVMTDLDHFKHLNDRYGHQAGDEVLIEFTRLISSNLRPHDIFGRIGGEEFLIILSNTDVEQALALAERLRDLVEMHIFKVNGHHIHITASSGVANYTSRADTFEKLIPFVDRALYLSKQNGRNRVTYLSPDDEMAEIKINEMA